MREFRILHLSDTHFMADSARHYGVTDTVAALEAVLNRASAVPRLELVACTGDLSEDGSEDSYRRLRSMVETWAAERGAAVVYAMGNHDVRGPFRQVLQPPAQTQEAVYSSVMVGETLVVVLDTSVPGAGYGRLDDAQLRWLADQLAQPAPGGTVLVMHHPPVPAETALLRALELQEPQRFLDALRGTDVRVVLAGHYHAALTQNVDGLTVTIAPAVTNQADIFAPAGTEGALGGSGASLVTVSETGVRVLPFTVSRPGDGEQVFHFDAQTVARYIDLAGA